MATKDEIRKILASLHLDASPAVVDGLREVFFKSGIIDKDEIVKILRGAKKKVVVLAQGSGKKIYVDILKAVGSYIDAHDRETFKEIDRVAFKFKEYLLANKIPTSKIDEVISKVYLAIREKNGEINTQISDFTAEDLEQLMASACVYNSINKYIKQQKGEERVADIIFLKKIIPSLLNNQSNKFEMAVANNVEGLLAELTSVQEGMYPEEAFSEVELEKLIYKTTSVLFNSSAEKVKKVREVLGEFAHVVQEQAKQAGEDEEIINSLTVKSILLKCGAILTLGEKTLIESVGLLSGKPFSLVIDQKSVSGGYKIASEYLPALKIDGLTTKKQIYFLTGRPSMLKDLGVKSVLEGLENLIDCTLIAKGEDVSAMKFQDKISAMRKLGVEPSKLLHADNLVDVLGNKYLTDSNLKGNCAENFKYISSVINESMALSLLRHNVSFLCLDSTIVQDKIGEIVNNASGDAYLIEKELEELFNATYTHNNTKQKSTKKEEKPEGLLSTSLVQSEEEKEKISVVLTNGMFGAKKNFKRVKPEITAENYFDRLDVELDSINDYLFARMTKTTVFPEKGTIGYILVEMSKSTAISQLQKGQIASKMEEVAKMLEFAFAEGDEDKYEYIQAFLDDIRTNYEFYLDVINKDIEETKDFADMVFSASKNNGVKTNISDIRVALKTLDISGKTKSKSLRAQLEQLKKEYEKKLIEEERKIEDAKKNSDKVTDEYSDYSKKVYERDCAVKVVEFLIAKQDKQQKREDEEPLVDLTVDKTKDLSEVLAEKRKKLEVMQKEYDDKFRGQGENPRHSVARRMLKKIKMLTSLIEELEEQISENE